MGRDELVQRADDFARGLWSNLLADARKSQHQGSSKQESGNEQERRSGQVSRARHELTGAPLPPKNLATLNGLRERRPQERQSLVQQEVLDFEPQSTLQLDAELFARCLQMAPFGSSPGPGGCTNEMLRVCLDDRETLELQTTAAEDLARATVPGEVTRSFMLASMTALQTVAFQESPLVQAFDDWSQRHKHDSSAKTCAPFQFALSTRAGVDCVGHAVRVATDANPEATVMSIDGIAAYDHVHRSAKMGKLLRVPGLQCLLPFVRATYGSGPTQMESSTTYTSKKGANRVTLDAIAFQPRFTSP